MKRCLTIARELRGKFAEFTLALGTLEKKIKGAKKWTKEVDEQFLKEAGKFGVTAETAGEMRRAGGFRNFYESSIKELKLSKGELDSEVKELENKLSSEGQIFQTVSFSPSAEYGKVVKIKKIIKMVLAVINAVTAFCESTGACS